MASNNIYGGCALRIAVEIMLLVLLLASQVTATGQVWIWGNNGFGQLGDGTSLDRLNPVQVMILQP